MRSRIGSDGLHPFRNGQHFTGGRNKGGLSEFERLFHLIASMQNIFGSPRSCLILPLLLIGLCLGGWLVFRNAYSPEHTVELAHRKFNSDDTKVQIAAIKEYQALLQKKDPIDPARFWVRDDRDTLYRRIVVHEFKFQKNEAKASEWIIAAWDEGIRDLRIQETDVKEFWNATVEPLKRKSLIKDKNLKSGPEDQKFDSIPGLDDAK